MRSLLVLVLMTWAAFGSDPCPEPAQEKCPLDGRWQMVKAEVMGKNLIDEQLKKTLHFAKGKVTIPSENDKSGGTYKLDAKQSPGHIDMTSDKGPTTKGIYKVEKDRLVICMSLKGERPTNFDAANAIVLTLEKVKK